MYVYVYVCVLLYLFGKQPRILSLYHLYVAKIRGGSIADASHQPQLAKRECLPCMFASLHVHMHRTKEKVTFGLPDYQSVARLLVALVARVEQLLEPKLFVVVEARVKVGYNGHNLKAERLSKSLQQKPDYDGPENNESEVFASDVHYSVLNNFRFSLRRFVFRGQVEY
jgi:hypothetical protein